MRCYKSVMELVVIVVEAVVQWQGVLKFLPLNGMLIGIVDQRENQVGVLVI